MRRIVGATAAALLVVLLAAPAVRAEAPAMPGFSVVSTTTLAPGLVHTVLHRDAPRQVVHVARLNASSRLRLRAVLSNEAISEPGARLERTTAMCARVSCVVAVNGDFAAVGTDEPVGAMVVDGEMVRTPVESHHQLTLGDGALTAGALSTRTQIVPTDLKPLVADAVNRARGDGQLILYTRAYNTTTSTNPHGVELALDLVGGRIVTNQTVVARARSIVEGGNTAIPEGGAILSGHGDAAEALRDLWRRMQTGSAAREVMVRVDTSAPADTVIGGTPVLVRDGRSWVATTGDDFVTGRHPRTVVGWTPTRDLLLVTVDGRQRDHSVGMTLPEAAELMVALGAVEALNLDGGGSTTFVTGSQIANSPSDRIVVRNGAERLVHEPLASDQVIGAAERPVVSALAIVDDARGPHRATTSVPDVPSRTVRYFAAADPASLPDGTLAALVGHPASPPAPRGLLVLAVFALTIATGGVVRAARIAT